MSTLPPEGWYPDPNVPDQNRYWDGAEWTERTVPAGTQPPAGAAPEAGADAAHERPNGGLGALTTPQRISAIAIVVVAVAAFLPWVSVLGVSKMGVEGDGVITLILAIIGAALFAWSTGLIGRPRSPGRGSQITLLVLAALVALIGLLDMNGFAAIGLYLTFLGGAAWVVGAAWQLGQRGRPQAPRAG